MFIYYIKTRNSRRERASYSIRASIALTVPALVANGEAPACGSAPIISLDLFFGRRCFEEVFVDAYINMRNLLSSDTSLTELMAKWPISANKAMAAFGVEARVRYTVVWRQKEQFSDGVGYGWIDKLRDFADEKITNEMMETAEFRYPRSPPKTKETYLYRQSFEKYFPEEKAAMKWDEPFIEHDDPSGRAMINVHVDGYGLNSGVLMKSKKRLAIPEH
ncbi:asparagine synthetase [Perkinsus olseni]|uniref:Asparagine synthetase n=1 Tax=Perkinsus olseni TaxID=32597 RepID=A0A7J6S1N8_PEROL|nr:asparagine synthetase [Perkinsus olseni]KAF4741381.1 asparagine synthetase [Perkinsus olseni]